MINVFKYINFCYQSIEKLEKGINLINFNIKKKWVTSLFEEKNTAEMR